MIAISPGPTSPPRRRRPTACSRLRRPVVLSQHPLDNRHLQVGESRTSKASGSGAGRSVGQPSRSRGLFGMSMWYVSHLFLIVLFILSCSWSSPCLPPLLSFQFVQSPPPGGLADLLSSSSLGTSWLGRGTLFLHASSLRVLKNSASVPIALSLFLPSPPTPLLAENVVYST